MNSREEWPLRVALVLGHLIECFRSVSRLAGDEAGRRIPGNVAEAAPHDGESVGKSAKGQYERAIRQGAFLNLLAAQGRKGNDL